MTKKKEETNNDNQQQLVQDFELMKRIIDNCTARGAFKANELSTVGTLYERLQLYIENLATKEDDG